MADPRWIVFVILKANGFTTLDLAATLWDKTCFFMERLAWAAVRDL